MKIDYGHTMTDTTMTLRISSELKRRLEGISMATRRSKSFLASEAVMRFVESEEVFINGLKAAQAEIKEGLGITHSVVMAEMDALIDQTAQIQDKADKTSL